MAYRFWDPSAALRLSCQLACEPYFQLQKRNRMVELSFTGYSWAAIWEIHFWNLPPIDSQFGWSLVSSLQSGVIQRKMPTFIILNYWCWGCQESGPQSMKIFLFDTFMQFYKSQIWQKKPEQLVLRRYWLLEFATQGKGMCIACAIFIGEVLLSK